MTARSAISWHFCEACAGTRPALVGGNMVQRIKGAKAWVPVLIALAGACGGTVVNGTDADQSGAGANGGAVGGSPSTGNGSVGRAGSSSSVAGGRAANPPASFSGASPCEAAADAAPSSGGYSSVEFAVDDGRGEGGGGGDYPATYPASLPTNGTRCIGFIDCVYPVAGECPTSVAGCGTDGIWVVYSPQCSGGVKGLLQCPLQLPKDGTVCSLPSNVDAYSCRYSGECGPLIARCSAPGVWTRQAESIGWAGASSSG